MGTQQALRVDGQKFNVNSLAELNGEKSTCYKRTYPSNVSNDFLVVRPSQTPRDTDHNSVLSRVVPQFFVLPKIKFTKKDNEKLTFGGSGVELGFRVKLNSACSL
ncbi:hypothetical protein OUZ56_026597 [Daphnia magna]|uniref:Uncharacterized protein n=1 Tax=Daphnia magna TaxID=35525 RepID=A0ABQ9ZN09_9CRUS|nr:hypothetical protein OUZ56_026597 [Daphnia magna]